MGSVYIHIPFCKSICSYCDFCKMYYNGSFVTKYLNALINEIQERYLGEEVHTLYIGGGTPSSLTLKDLKYLFEIISKFNLEKLEEFTFECNLDDITEELLDFLKINGVNRLSIGIESFNEEKLKFMERKHTFLEAEEKMKLIRKVGFDNVNIDLIYGIPGETLKDLKKDLDLILNSVIEANKRVVKNNLQYTAKLGLKICKEFLYYFAVCKDEIKIIFKPFHTLSPSFAKVFINGKDYYLSHEENYLISQSIKLKRFVDVDELDVQFQVNGNMLKCEAFEDFI